MAEELQTLERAASRLEARLVAEPDFGEQSQIREEIETLNAQIARASQCFF
jgi:hypothetical protein